MGWITGVFCFVIATVFFTISVFSIASKGGLAEFYRQQLAVKGAPDETVRQFFEVLENPSGLATILRRDTKVARRLGPSEDVIDGHPLSLTVRTS